MPTPAAFSPIQRVPSGFPGPGGIGCAPAAHGEGGGTHHGFSCLSTIRHRPDGVGYADCPVATWKVRTRRLLSYSLSEFAPRLITTTGPRLSAVRAGTTASISRT